MAETCAVTRYRCPVDASKIAKLAALASAQQAANAGFSKEIFPWERACLTDSYVHYVAKDTSGILCGWLVADFKEVDGQKCIYLAQIATRRITDSLYGGVGQKLHQALVRDAIEQDYEFIYLYPLDASVADIYKRPEWSYIQVRPEIQHLFRYVTGVPKASFLDTLMPPSSKNILLRAKEIAQDGLRNAALLKRIEKAEPRILQNPEHVEDLDHYLDYMESMNLSAKDQRAKLWEYFTKYLEKEGI